MLLGLHLPYQVCGLLNSWIRPLKFSSDSVSGWNDLHTEVTAFVFLLWDPDWIHRIVLLLFFLRRDCSNLALIERYYPEFCPPNKWFSLYISSDIFRHLWATKRPQWLWHPCSSWPRTWSQYPLLHFFKVERPTSLLIKQTDFSPVAPVLGCHSSHGIGHPLARPREGIENNGWRGKVISLGV